ncbi:hypothetical protein ACFSL4_34135 [Streptomyces caeni]|uniref:DUF2933 domain-containing protein n=1 Tax=Streptomyces caeni TaxID=2307231 RepID=A0ABW4J0K8_9ACTN
MDEPRRTPSGVPVTLRRLVPPPALAGFLLLLALVFAVSYAVGAGAGPVAPGMHAPGTGADGGDHGGDMGDMGDMGHGHGGVG